MRRLVGLDINGWHDFAVRDRRDDGSDDATAERIDGQSDQDTGGAPVTIDGGIGGVVVSHGDVEAGGPQAILSPIGRGGGWSRVGDPAKRRDLRSLWRGILSGPGEAGTVADLRIAADALAVGADALALCMPDRPEMAEAAQAAVLRALAGPRRPAATLIWRSVALMLAALDGGQLAGARDGLRVLCVIHVADGLELQTFVLRDLHGHSGWLAPERDRGGNVVCPEAGLDALLSCAVRAVEAANPGLAAQSTEAPRLPLTLLLDGRGSPLPEVVRRDNGTWMLAQPPVGIDLPWSAMPGAAAPEADVVLLHTPLAARHSDKLRAWLGDTGGAPLMTMPPQAPALGALYALRRIGRGIPHYLDRLDQVALAVLRDSGPAFEALIPPDATVPGNREYVSKTNTSMVWPAGMAKAEFFVLKGEREIRTLTTPTESPPATNQRLEIVLRQKPAQGWATLHITATAWEALRRAPIRLEWSALAVDPRSAQEVLDALRGPAPVVPEPVHYPPHIGLWDGSLRAPGIESLLERARPGRGGGLHDLADALGRSVTVPPSEGRERTRVYAVGTDGSLPPELAASTVRRFEHVIASVADDLARRCRDDTVADNDALRCLTWCFARCPPEIARNLAAAVRAHGRGESHPLLQPTRAVVVVFQGLGRAATEAALLEEMIPLLADGQTMAYRMGALAAMLSRPVDTPSALARLDVAALAGRIAGSLDTVHRDRAFGVHLKYALLAIGGLLRVRLHDPWALVADHSAPADRLARRLDGVAASLARNPAGVAAAGAKRESAKLLATLLRGKGGRPDILVTVDALPED